MCQSKAEGGQRCYGHARPRLDAAQATYARTGDPADLDYLIEVQADLASTPKGEQEIREQINAATAAGNHTQAAVLTHVLQRGQMMAQVNREVARLYRAKVDHAARADDSHNACEITREFHAALAVQAEVMDLAALRQAARDAAARHAQAEVTAPAKAHRSLFRSRRPVAVAA